MPHDKAITWDMSRANQGGFVCHLDGEEVAIAWSYGEAEATLNALAAEIDAEIARLANDEPVLPLALAA